MTCTGYRPRRQRSDQVYYDLYYRCPGHHSHRGQYGRQGKFCPTKDFRGQEIEAAITRDIETFYRHPGLVIRKLEQQTGSRDEQQRRAMKAIAACEKALAARDLEESNNVTFLNRGKLTEKQFDAEKRRIERERVVVEAELAEWRKAAADFDSQAARLEAARLRLTNGSRGNHPRTFEELRQDFLDLVEYVRSTTATGNRRLDSRSRTHSMSTSSATGPGQMRSAWPKKALREGV